MQSEEIPVPECLLQEKSTVSLAIALTHPSFACMSDLYNHSLPRHAQGGRANGSSRQRRSSLDKLPKTVAARVEAARRGEVVPSSLWSDHCTEEAKVAGLLSARDRIANLEAVGPAEQMLATMMVNTFEAYTECQHRAMIHVGDPRIFSIYMGYSDRLIKSYILQLAARDKHRARGKQQVLVEHVHVGAGGQAIVGKLDIHSGETRRCDASEDNDR